MKALNRFVIFVIGISQVALASNKIEPKAPQPTKIETPESKMPKKTLAETLHEKKLIGTEKSSESSNCVGKLTD